MTCENKLKSSDSNSRWGNLLSSLPSSLPPPPPYHPGFLSLFLLPTCDHRLSRLPPLLAACTLSSESEHPVLWQRLHQAGLFAPILRADLRQGPVKRRRTQSQEALAQLLAITNKDFSQKQLSGPPLSVPEQGRVWCAWGNEGNRSWKERARTRGLPPASQVAARTTVMQIP